MALRKAHVVLSVNEQQREATVRSLLDHRFFGETPGIIAFPLFHFFSPSSMHPLRL